MEQNSRWRMIDQDFTSLNFYKYYLITIFKKGTMPNFNIFLLWKFQLRKTSLYALVGRRQSERSELVSKGYL